MLEALRALLALADLKRGAIPALSAPKCSTMLAVLSLPATENIALLALNLLKCFGPCCLPWLPGKCGRCLRCLPWNFYELPHLLTIPTLKLENTYFLNARMMGEIVPCWRYLS